MHIWGSNQPTISARSSTVFTPAVPRPLETDCCRFSTRNPYLRRIEEMASATDADGNLMDPTLHVKPLNIIAITDGAFTDDAETVIVEAARRLDGPRCEVVPWQAGVQFFQTGNDKAATKHLQQLDDDPGKRVRGENLRDIVDTVPWKGEAGHTLTADGILKCVLGAGA